MASNSIKSLFITLFLLSSLLITSCNPELGEDDEGVFVLVVGDGDTLMLESGQWVRLLGINAPERGDEVYEDAKYKLEDLVRERNVVLEKDVSEKDVYGRLLRYVYVNNVSVNMIMLEQGMARASFYEPDIKYQQEFELAEQEAINKSLGIWKYGIKDYTLDSNETCVNLGCSSGTVFVGSKNSNIYHYCSCEWAENIEPANIICFESEKEAKAENYRACKVCRPLS